VRATEGMPLRYSPTTQRKTTRLALTAAGCAIAVTGISSGGTTDTAGAAPAATPAASITLTGLTRPLTPATYRTPTQIARSMLASYGWSSAQFPYLYRLWNRESGWNPRAYNRASGAYGIPQASPGSKMASAGRDWRTNPATQIRWGLRYIKQRYGSPHAAWNHSIRYGWY
jgi:resuscitation-promoting factor RpfB